MLYGMQPCCLGHQGPFPLYAHLPPFIRPLAQPPPSVRPLARRHLPVRPPSRRVAAGSDELGCHYGGMGCSSRVG